MEINTAIKNTKLNKNLLPRKKVRNQIFYNYLLTTILLFLGAGSSSLWAGTIDIKMVNPQENNGKYCVQMQVRSQGNDLRVGNSTIMFHYSTPAIRNPKAAPINLAPQPCPGSGDANLYTGSFTQIEDDVLGDGIYNLVLKEAFTACPLVTKEWMTIADICFDVINPNRSIKLRFNAQQSIIRTDANGPSKHTLGVLKGIQQLANVVCNDNLQNGGETGVDCGGLCVFCSSSMDEDEEVVVVAPDLDGGFNGDIDIIDPDTNTNDEEDLEEEVVIVDPDTDTDLDETNDEDEIDIVPETDDQSTYCTVRGENTRYEWIESFTLGDISNVSKNSDGYGAYTDMITVLEREKKYTFELEPGFKSKNYFETWCIFVDWNQDGDFRDSGELTYNKRSDQTIIDDIEVPPHALQGITRIRVVMAYDRKSIKPCKDVKWGEIEDYRIEVVGEPLANFVKVCSPPNASTDYEWIESLKLNNDTYSSGNNDGYGDFTDTPIQMTIGQSYELELKAGYINPQQQYKEYWRIFIDYNQDKDFDDEGEIAFDSQMAVKDKAIGQLNIPADVLKGNTTMRIIMKFGKKPPQACQQGTKWGEVEDYTIEFIE